MSYDTPYSDLSGKHANQIFSCSRAEGKITGSLRFRMKAIFALLVFAGSADAQEPYYPPPETKGGWRSVVTANGVPTPEQKAKILGTTDLNWDRLQEAWKYCEGFGGPHSVLVIRRGWIAAEWNNFTDPRTIASCTKSLTGLAMAKLFDLSDSGRFPERVRVSDPAYLFMPPSWAEGDPRRKRILLRHLLTMSSGQDPYDGPYEDMNAYAKTVLNVGIEAPPGTVWAYSSAAVDQLSHVIESVSGMTQGEFFHREISEPIGVAPFEWTHFRGHTRGSGGAKVMPRDLARIGYLMLQKGVWNRGSGNIQILSAARVSMITHWAPFLGEMKFREPNFARERQAQDFYGYLWWTNRTQQPLGKAVPKDVFYMSGFGKQACWIFPSLDMVVVRLGSNATLNDHPEFYPELLSRVMAAVESVGATK